MKEIAEAIISIQDADEYARIYTKTIVPSYVGGWSGNEIDSHDVLLAVARTEVRTKNECTEWDSNRHCNVPVSAEHHDGIIFVFGVREDAEIKRLSERADSAEYSNTQSKETISKLEKEKEALVDKINELTKDISSKNVAKSAKEDLLAKESALRLKLETDLAKIRNYFGEKSFNEALTK